MNRGISYLHVVNSELFLKHPDSMPVRQMKVKSTTACAREGSCLQVYHRSSKKCKKSSIPVRVAHQAADLDTPNQTYLNGSTVDDVCIQEHGVEVTPAQEVLCCEENPGNHNSSFPDEASERSIKACASTLETIYNSFMGYNHLHPSYMEEENEDTNVETKVGGDKSNNRNHSSSTNQTSYPLDSNVAEIILSELSTHRMGEMEDTVNYNYYSHYEFAAPTLVYEVNDDIKMFSSLEETTDAADQFYADSFDDFLLNSDDSWFHQVIHQANPWSQGLDFDSILIDSGEVKHSDPQSYITNVPDPSDESDSLPPLVSEETSKKKQVTLVLDLDETLVHSTLEPCDDADFTIQVYFEMKEHTVYVRKRPFLLTFLERVIELFDIIVFTASQSVYAEQLLDVLDPDKKFFSRRVYRDSCIFSDGGYTKDLTVLGIDLAKVVIVDNTPQVFRLQTDNGIPIKSWFDDPSDRALMSLLPFLETLVYVDDVRPIIGNKFRAKD